MDYSKYVMHKQKKIKKNKQFFLGPLQITGSSFFSSMNPIEMTPRFSLGYTGTHPSALPCTSSPSQPNIRGIEGPQISISRIPT